MTCRVFLSNQLTRGGKVHVDLLAGLRTLSSRKKRLFVVAHFHKAVGVSSRHGLARPMVVDKGGGGVRRDSHLAII